MWLVLAPCGGPERCRPKPSFATTVPISASVAARSIDTLFCSFFRVMAVSRHQRKGDTGSCPILSESSTELLDLGITSRERK
jgi:hypothetical protein